MQATKDAAESVDVNAAVAITSSGAGAEPTPKQQRLFIARQACEICRQKKTRCDGGNPCGMCRSSGFECVFAERKATKNEVSLGMIFNALQRIERKIEHPAPSPGAGAGAGAGTAQAVLSSKRRRRESSLSQGFVTSPGATFRDEPPEPYVQAAAGTMAQMTTASPANTVNSTVSAPRSAPHVPVIEYPARQAVTWPVIHSMLKRALGEDRYQGYSVIQATLTEQKRPPIAFAPASSMSVHHLSRLHISHVRDLCDKFFATFNLTYPILDRKLFSQHTLGVAINSDFGYNIESCLVLVVMALGTYGQRALHEGGFGFPAALAGEAGPRVSESVPEDGLSFFNEARQRIGLINCDNSIQSCQYYLLCGLFYSQLLRPIDWWTMVNRASVCVTSFWACPPEQCDGWMIDMQARLFWNTAMFQALLTQELDLPISNLEDFEDRVPLPKFVEFPGLSSMVSLTATTNESDERDAFCHYHFLSQIAHRIILTRMCDSMFASRKKRSLPPPTSEVTMTTMSRADYPPQALEDELLHQLDQWRQQLPPYLQWDDAAPVPLPDSPENILVEPWLRGRFWIARYHLRRPLLHRALHHPETMTNADFDKCRDALSCLFKWHSIVRHGLTIRSCLPLTFFICTQLFGQLLILEALRRSPVQQLRELPPDDYDSWCRFALGILEEYVSASPIVARDFEIASALLSGK